jgi:Protein of unknown function (DUF3105)
VRGVWLERLAIAVASLTLAIALIAVLSGYFADHDQAAVSGDAKLGMRFADQGDGVLAAPSLPQLYDSDPPTSGPHVRVPVAAQGLTLSDNQILTALAAGDVVILYGTRRPPHALAALAGPFTPSLAAAGFAVVLGRRPGTSGVVALAWTRMLRGASPSDPRLRQFVQALLGHARAGG